MCPTAFIPPSVMRLANRATAIRMKSSAQLKSRRRCVPSATPMKWRYSSRVPMDERLRQATLTRRIAFPVMDRCIRSGSRVMQPRQLPRKTWRTLAQPATATSSFFPGTRYPSYIRWNFIDKACTVGRWPTAMGLPRVARIVMEAMESFRHRMYIPRSTTGTFRQRVGSVTRKLPRPISKASTDKQ